MEIRTLAEGLQFPEGPVALGDGSVLLVEIAGGTLTRIDADGTKTIAARTGGGPNGAALGPGGHCYIANNGGFEWHREGGHIRPLTQAKDYAGGRIERVDLKTGAVEVLYRACGDVPLKGARGSIVLRSLTSSMQPNNPIDLTAPTHGWRSCSLRWCLARTAPMRIELPTMSSSS